MDFLKCKLKQLNRDCILQEISHGDVCNLL